MIRDLLLAGVLGALACLPAVAESCLAGNEVEAPTRTALEQAAGRYLQMAQQGDVFNLRQSAIGGLAHNFHPVEALVLEAKPDIAAAVPSPRGTYLLDAPGNAPLARAEFFCGVFGSTGHTSQSVGFSIPNLPPGRYAIVMQDLQSQKKPYMFTLILQEQAGQWKIGGFYLKPGELAGHAPSWFLDQAREHKAKGQLHNAWFYYLTAWDLQAPVSFMSTRNLDRLADEMQQVRPTDLPSATSPLMLMSGGKSYKVTYMTPVAEKGELYLVVRFEAADVSNTQQAFADNMAVIKGLVQRYPEFRQGFAGVVARATEPSGRDYGSLLAMKDVK